ncbi:hypothetical protein DNK06_19595 [Pseudomonas daroniae]|uniref:Uncharacterized protein n=1 Tax=Phytopseudomonas daroniae TaxID=2487519 RepID=A0A4V2KAD6_9GAMM|nr:hypothetical protein DNK06_19595 [Pseudomonas daroniae]TBU85445.1 hypothetical protein DNK31_03660 [Pseudomonas sp. FRB 228]TBU94293.1 hypothetical protein DNJ99_03660 [Pseudomonas daroniae]
MLQQAPGQLFVRITELPGQMLACLCRMQAEVQRHHPAFTQRILQRLAATRHLEPGEGVGMPDGGTGDMIVQAHGLRLVFI